MYTSENADPVANLTRFVLRVECSFSWVVSRIVTRWFMTRDFSLAHRQRGNEYRSTGDRSEIRKALCTYAYRSDALTSRKQKNSRSLPRASRSSVFRYGIELFAFGVNDPRRRNTGRNGRQPSLGRYNIIGSRYLRRLSSGGHRK
jgi:hypothetical protein